MSNPALPSNSDQSTTEQDPTTRKHWIWRSIRRLAILYVILVALITINQRSLIYHPHKSNSLDAAEAAVSPGTLHDFRFDSIDGLQLNGWHFLRASERASNEEQCKKLLGQSQQVVLYFPGNARNRSYRTNIGEMFAKNDADVLIADYRGYGDNPGSPNEELFISDAHALWSYVVNECGVPNERIVIYGQSLGGGVAIRLAADLCEAGTPPAGLITVATFSSLGDVAQEHFPFIPAKWLLWDEYRSKNYISQVTSPFLHLHGTADQTVSYEIGTQLFEAAPAQSESGIEKQFVTIDGAGHNNLFRGQNFSIASQSIGSFLKQLRTRHESR